ncbi:hypothetical protein [Lichenicola sp.]|uniref:hypothetical protein n=1 Tax=Lichenicola sp. TaxID=2804529 RepID=UPI003AFF9B3F
MSWFQSGLIALALVTPAKHPAAAVTPATLQASPGDVIVDCGDFARVADGVYIGRSGAIFAVGTIRDDLGGDTFGPNALNIGGVDPARYLQQKCRM